MKNLLSSVNVLNAACTGDFKSKHELCFRCVTVTESGTICIYFLFTHKYSENNSSEIVFFFLFLHRAGQDQDTKLFCGEVTFYKFLRRSRQCSQWKASSSCVWKS